MFEHLSRQNMAILLLLLSAFGYVVFKPLFPAYAGTGGTNAVYLPFISAPCRSEIVEDGSFEAGIPNPYWKTSSNVGSAIFDNSPTPPAHSGTWKAWLGGDNLVQETMTQTLSIPNGVTAATLSYWWRVSTTEPTHPFDTLTVAMRDTNGVLLQTIETLTDGDANNSWRQSTWPLPVSTYAGRTVVLSFETTTDNNNPTSFFIDDVSLSVVCP
nr:choice-of-anchor J domain-containing protein [Ardenticatena sp.]